MKNITDFEDILKEKYGEKGTSTRDKYDADSLASRLGVMLKKARKEVMITQDDWRKNKLLKQVMKHKTKILTNKKDLFFIHHLIFIHFN